MKTTQLIFVAHCKIKIKKKKYRSLRSLRRIFLEQKRDFSQLIYDLVGYKLAIKTRRETKSLITEL